MTEYTKQIFSEDVSKDIRVFAFKVLRNVTISTPVDTGRARGNWQVGIDVPKTSVLSNLDRSGGSSLTSGLSQLSRVTRFNTVWITNNLDYIGKLNDGSSLQAPAKFVESGIVRALND